MWSIVHGSQSESRRFAGKYRSWPAISQWVFPEKYRQYHCDYRLSIVHGSQSQLCGRFPGKYRSWPTIALWTILGKVSFMTHNLTMGDSSLKYRSWYAISRWVFLAKYRPLKSARLLFEDLEHETEKQTVVLTQFRSVLPARGNRDAEGIILRGKFSKTYCICLIKLVKFYRHQVTSLCSTFFVRQK